MEARAGNSTLDFETLFSDVLELLNGSGLNDSLMIFLMIQSFLYEYLNFLHENLNLLCENLNFLYENLNFLCENLRFSL